MLGAIAGDIIGSVYEGHNVKTTDFPLFDDRCKGEPLGSDLKIEIWRDPKESFPSYFVIELTSLSLIIESSSYFRTDRESPRGDMKDLICRLPVLKSTYHKESFSTAKRAAFSISVANKESI